MMDVTVKTLDGQNKNFSVPENITVKEFKEKISHSIVSASRSVSIVVALKTYDLQNIQVDRQRLIFQGRVMQDDKPLKEYDVHGKVIHVVQRLPPQISTPTTLASGSTSRSSAQRDTPTSGASNLPGFDPDLLQGDVAAVDVRINLPGIPGSTSQSAQRLTVARAMLTMARHTLDRLDNPSASVASDDQTPMDTTDSTSSATDAGQSSSEANGTSATSTPIARLPTGEVATLLDELFTVNMRFQPYLERYRDLLRDDAPLSTEETERNERLVNDVTSILHYMSHCYHNLSDMTTDLTQAPPRYMAVHHVTTAIIQQSFPIQAQINVSNVPPMGTVASTTASTSSTSSTPSTTSTGTSTVPRRPATTTPLTTPTTAQATAPTSAPMIVPTPAPSTPPTGATSQPPAFMGLLEGQIGDWPFSTNGSDSVTITTDPVMFMEVGQDSVTVNSVTAAMTAVADVQVNTTGTTDSSAQTAPQLLIPPPLQLPPVRVGPGQMHQNIFQAIAQSMAQAPQASAQGAQAPPHPTGAATTRPQSILRTPHGVNINMTPTRLVTTPGGAQHFRMHLPTSIVFPPRAPGTSGASTTTADTNSVFAGAGINVTPRGTPPTSQSQASGLASAGSRTTTTGTTPPAQRPIPTFDPFLPCNSHHVDPSMRPHPAIMSQQMGDPGIATVVTNLVSGLMQNQRAFVQPNEQRPAETATPAASTTATAPADTQQAAPVPTPLVPVIEDLTQQILTAVNQPGSTEMNISVTQQPDGTAVSSTTQLTDSAVGDILQGIQASMTGQQPPETLNSFFTRIGDRRNIGPGDGLFDALIRSVSELLSVPDIIHILNGQYSPLNRTRRALQNFIRTQVLMDASVSEEHINTAVERIVENNVTSAIRELLTGADMRRGVDPITTVQAFFRFHITDAINLILNASDDSTFGRTLYERCRKFVYEFVALCRYILRHGQTAFNNILRREIHRHLGILGSGEMMRSWIEHVVVDTFAMSTTNLAMTEADVMKYVVWEGERRDRKRQNIDVPQPARNMSAASVDPPGPRTPAAPTPSTSASHTHPRPTQSSAPTVTNGDSDDWKAIVPDEWVPVISEDINRQQSQTPRPHSDAYMSGLPIKRRKVSQSAESAEKIASGATYLPDALKCAVESAQVEPITSIERVVLEASDDGALQMALDQQVEATLANRLQTDSDYDERRFPVSKEVFRKLENGDS